jgi:putative aldouronate transport system substrate-binding protein
MKKQSVRKLSLLTMVMLLLGVLGSACFGAGNLKPVELQFYMVGDGPKDLQLVQDKINEMAKKDLNCTVKFNFTTWTDYRTKYNLLLQTGQPVDLIYTASWLDYAKLAKKGVFKPLDKLIPKYAPEIKKFVSDSLWNQVKVNGKIYTIPSTYKEFVSNGFQYRKDLQKQFNLPEPNSLENVEAYMEGIVQNMPGQVVAGEVVNPGPTGCSFNALEILCMKYKWVDFQTPYGLVADYDNPSNLRQYWGSPDFSADMKMFKRWADKGFWSRSALSNKGDPTGFNNGKFVVVIQGLNGMKLSASTNAVAIAHPDWEVGYVSYPFVNGVAQFCHATQNGYGIPVASKNPERALMFYQKLLLDQRYNLLGQYGIEGVHYKATDGYYVPLGDPTKSAFPYEGFNGWGWRNPNYMLFQKNFDSIKKLFGQLEGIAEKTKYKGANIYQGFAEDYSSYQAERAALGTVLTQYLAPLEAGLVPDVDEAIKTFMEKAKAAGLDKIQAEYIKQWKAYCAQYKYK